MSQSRRTAIMVGIAVLMLIGTLWADAEFGSGASAQSLPSQVQVLATITEVNNYWISQNPTPGNSDWTQATYFTGDLAAYDATGQSNYLSFAESWASGHDYSLDGGNTTTYANYQAAGQVYIRLYQLLNNSSYISGITQSINGMVNSNVDNEWTWIDAINMSMPDFAELGSMDANTSYFTKMYALYSYTKYTLGLFDPVTGLWWENSTYANTSTYWSRGNGWVFAAHAKVLSVLPPSDPHYPEYLATFQTMAAALAQRQQPGGYWNADLGGTDYAGPESSGTSFFLYGIAWGLNNGILDQATYLPIAENAWNFLANTAVQPSGLLGYVQPTGSAPGPTTATTTEDFGVGAFLLAARQMELLTAWASGTTYTVSGAITPASLGNGATVTLSQNGITIAATTVQPGGNYSFASVLPGTYTVTPNKSGINFSPTSQSVTVSGGPATVSTFSAQTATITGLALDSSTPAAVKTNTQTLTTASFTPPAGSVLYICVMLNSNASPATDQNYVSQITDNLSTHLTYTLQKQYGTASGNSAIVYLYTASVSTSQAMTVSITQGAADTSISNAMVQVLVITGANASSPVGKTAGAGATTTNISGTDYNSSVNDSWSWLIYADYAAQAVPTVPSGETVYSSYTNTMLTAAVIENNSVTATAGTAVTIKTSTPTSGVDLAWLAFEMVPVSTSPVAVNDSYSTTENTTLNEAAPGVLSNDTDPQGLPLTAELVSSPSHGTLTLNSNGSFTYIPASNYVGSDSFTYMANDGTYSSNVATVTIGVSPTLVSVALNPTSVSGGSTAQGTVTLSGPAPSGGAVVSLSSSDSSVASVPPNVTVPSGNKSANFSVNTDSVSILTILTISASYGGVIESSLLTVTVSNPVPTTTSLSPASATAGGTAFTLTVNGTGFVSGSTVNWKGSGRTTTYVSPTQVTAAITAADIASGGTAAVTVVNATPGGGTSNAQTFTIIGLALDSSTPAAVKTNTQTLTTASFTPPAGSVLYICVMLNSNASPATDQNYVNKITDNLGTHLTYTLQKQYGTASANSAIVYLYTASVSTSQAMTVSITQGATDSSISNAMVQVLVITGANASSPVGKTAGAGATTTNISGTDYNSSVNDSWSWLIYADYAAQAVPTVPSGETVYSSYTNTMLTAAVIENNSVTATAGTAVTIKTSTPTSGVDLAWLAFEIIP